MKYIYLFCMCSVLIKVQVCIDHLKILIHESMHYYHNKRKSYFITLIQENSHFRLKKGKIHMECNFSASDHLI